MNSSVLYVVGLLMGGPSATVLAADVPSPFLTQPGGAGRGEQTASLPPGEGREEVEASCSACHSLRMVTQQRLSRQRWNELLGWMVEEQGMAELDPATHALVLDYLAGNLGIGG